MGVCMLYAQQGPILGLILAAAVLKFLTLFEQGALHFCFALGPANDLLPSPEIGEGDGTPLQFSCLENPMDRGAWWAAVHGVAKSQTE